MVTDRWIRKIVAFLHDPPGKAFVLRSTRHTPHEYFAAALQRDALGGGVPDDEKNRATKADHIAAAADRVNFPEGATAYWDQVTPQLTHPAAAGASPQPFLMPSSDLNLDNEIQGEARQVIQRWKDAVGDGTQRLYLHLWRLLYEELTKRTSLKGWVRLLPADTRQPDHPLEQHLSISAAIADALPKPAFLVFSIGPVQDFIAAARRTQDLWMGSWVLSSLAWKAMETLAEEFGPDVVVFPSLRSQPLCDRWLYKNHGLPCKPSSEDLARPTFPNKFVALLPEGEAEAAARQAEEAVRAEWKRLAIAVYEALFNEFLADGETRRLWEEQIGRHLEVYWIVLPWIGADQNLGMPQAETVKARYRELLPPEGMWEFQETYNLLDKSGQYDPNWGMVYSLHYDLADRAFNARKNLRDFQDAEEKGEKCTVCGQRAALRSKARDARTFWKEVAGRLRQERRYDIRQEGRERLCAVCTVKRFVQGEVLEREFGLQAGFPSTSEVAAAGFKAKVLEKLDDQKVAQALREFLEYVEQIGIPPTVSEGAIPRLQKKARVHEDLAKKLLELDGEYLFVETWAVSHLRDVLPNISEAQMQEGRKRLRELHKAVGAAPRKYYAVLYMDGDHMGRWLSGTHPCMATFGDTFHPEVRKALDQDPQWRGLLSKKRVLAPAVHAAISGALTHFSLKLVRWVVEERYTGRVVYAGGDDVLAFVPVEEALCAARELRALFSGAVRINGGAPDGNLRSSKWEVAFGDKACTGYLVFDGVPMLTMGPSATASIGIAIAHYLHPLDLVLQAARRAEREAKHTYGRNALAVEILKRSGESITVGIRWSYADIPDPVAWLIDFCALLEDGKISGKFPHAVAAVAPTLEDLRIEAQKAELRRLLKRQAGESVGREEEKERQAEEWSERLVQLAQALKSSPVEESGLRRVANWLLACSFIVRGGEE